MMQVAIQYETIPENCLAKLQMLTTPPLFETYHKQIINEWETKRVFGYDYSKMLSDAANEYAELPKSSTALDNFMEQFEARNASLEERWKALVQFHRTKREAEIIRMNGVLSIRLLDPVYLDASR